MKAETIAYLKSQKPQIDVLGRWVYLPNARTGSTSITAGPLADRVIMRHRGKENWERVWNKVIEPRLDEAVMFTFVRNPWDRVVSAWQLLQDRGRLAPEESFKAFVGRGGLADREHDHFFQPQAPSFMRGGVVIPEVIIGRHESREEDWWRIASLIGCAGTLPCHNATEHKPYWEYYDTETVSIVKRAYAAEIDALGYEFGT